METLENALNQLYREAEAVMGDMTHIPYIEELVQAHRNNHEAALRGEEYNWSWQEHDLFERAAYFGHVPYSRLARAMALISKTAKDLHRDKEDQKKTLIRFLGSDPAPFLEGYVSFGYRLTTLIRRYLTGGLA